MAGNSFGTLFRFTTWGESHGPAIGVVVDGMPPRLPLSEPDIQHWLDKRKPGQSRYTTQRREEDLVRILSGVFEGVTTGTPIQLLIENTDQRSKDYRNIADRFRPGHADYTYWKKYGVRDYRGGGRASARETASRVAAGALARNVLGPGITIRGALVRIGPHQVDRDAWDWRATEENPFWCPDRATAPKWAEYLDAVRKAGSSTGAVIEIVASGVPAGLGEPIYDKLDGDLARALMTINAVKGVEIGAGFAAAALSGEENADEMRMVEDRVAFLSNHAGGHPGRHFDGAGHRRALCRQADEFDLDPDALGRRRGQRRRDFHPWPARPVRGYPCRPGRRSDGRLRTGRPSAAVSRIGRSRLTACVAC